MGRWHQWALLRLLLHLRSMNPKCENCPIEGPCHAMPSLCAQMSDLERREFWKRWVDEHGKLPEGSPLWPGANYRVTGSHVRELVHAVFSWLKSGAPLVSNKELERRRLLCPECFELGKCKQCGCFVEIKARMATAHCPKGRW